jgi:hypothetical protein
MQDEKTIRKQILLSKDFNQFNAILMKRHHRQASQGMLQKRTKQAKPNQCAQGEGRIHRGAAEPKIMHIFSRNKSRRTELFKPATAYLQQCCLNLFFLHFEREGARRGVREGDDALWKVLWKQQRLGAQFSRKSLKCGSLQAQSLRQIHVSFAGLRLAVSLPCFDSGSQFLNSGGVL